jgi:hypothetical protein
VEAWEEEGKEPENSKEEEEKDNSDVFRHFH